MAIPLNMEYFDEYIRQGDSQKREGRSLVRGYWFAGGGRTEGIRLFAGTCPKKYKGFEISMEEVNKLLDKYYEEKHRIRDTWSEYETYIKIDVHPDSEGSKRGRPI